MVEINLPEIRPDTEIRKLSGRHTNGLIQILEQNNDWKKLMAEIRLDCFNLDDEKYKYTDDDIKTISAASSTYQRTCTELLFDEWGTSGRRRPTVELLHAYFEKIKLWRAADYVARNLLRLPVTEYSRDDPAKKVNIDDINLDLNTQVQASESIFDSCQQKSTVRCGGNIESSVKELENQIHETHITVDDMACQGDRPNPEEISSRIKDCLDRDIKKMPYERLKIATNNFDSKFKLGSGAFGSVYFAQLDTVDLAIKVLETSTLEHFERELTILTDSIDHPKLLPPIALSLDHLPCLIYPFMPHGSLEDRLALKMKEKSPLSWQKRIFISNDIIEGLEYLHTRPKPIVHRDIKTSNILLDSNDVAKIGDFGLVRKKTKMATSTVSTIQGTDAYMAPEAHRFQITAKIDVYSFGMVLLELLTGLSIIDESRGHLWDYIEQEVEENNKDVTSLLDEKAGNWDEDITEELYTNATQCIEYDSKKRPSSSEVKNNLEQLVKRVIEN